MPRRESKKSLHEFPPSILNVSSLHARSETLSRDTHSLNPITVPIQHNHRPLSLFKVLHRPLSSMPLNVSIIKSIRTPTHTNLLPPLPPFPLTPSQRQLLQAATPTLVRFPAHLFPQLRDFEAVCQGKPALKMDPLPMNWEYTYRPNRPFDRIPHLRPQDQAPPPPPPPPRPAIRPRNTEPTAYFLEQVCLAREDPGFHLLITEPPIVVRPKFRLWVEAVAALLMMLAGFGVSLATWVLGRLKLGALWCLWYPLKRMCKMILQIEWEVYLAVALAAQVSRFLPGVGGEVGRELDVAKKPLYVVFWGGEGKRIVTGAVLNSGIM